MLMYVQLGLAVVGGTTLVTLGFGAYLALLWVIAQRSRQWERITPGRGVKGVWALVLYFVFACGAFLTGVSVLLSLSFSSAVSHLGFVVGAGLCAGHMFCSDVRIVCSFSTMQVFGGPRQGERPHRRADYAQSPKQSRSTRFLGALAGSTIMMACAVYAALLVASIVTAGIRAEARSFVRETEQHVADASNVIPTTLPSGEIHGVAAVIVFVLVLMGGLCLFYVRHALFCETRLWQVSQRLRTGATRWLVVYVLLASATLLASAGQWLSGRTSLTWCVCGTTFTGCVVLIGTSRISRVASYAMRKRLHEVAAGFLRRTGPAAGGGRQRKVCSRTALHRMTAVSGALSVLVTACFALMLVLGEGEDIRYCASDIMAYDRGVAAALAGKARPNPEDIAPDVLARVRKSWAEGAVMYPFDTLTQMTPLEVTLMAVSDNALPWRFREVLKAKYLLGYEHGIMRSNGLIE